MEQGKELTARVKTQTIITAGVVALILFFLIRFLLSNWRQVATFDFTFTYSYLILSFPVLFVFFFLRVYAWQAILKKMQIALPLSKCLKVSFLSMMGKYLPGKVWTVLGKVYLSDKEGAPKAETFTSVVIEIVLEIVASIFFFFFYLFSLMEEPLLSTKILYLLALILVGGLVFLHPRVFYTVLNTLLRTLKKETIPEAIKYRDIIQIFLLYIVIILVQGAAFYLFVNALLYVPFQNLV
ncbi:MAG: lysylphosphatidylglycerol synthase domain-containing protein, partial [Thermodesulfobacteriota bacterium]|nr:lysylphosphatidylglycerol synthase domain-containing protein [Thermodesulfobacteriota bacterium]